MQMSLGASCLPHWDIRAEKRDTGTSRGGTSVIWISSHNVSLNPRTMGGFTLESPTGVLKGANGSSLSCVPTVGAREAVPGLS